MNPQEVLLNPGVGCSFGWDERRTEHWEERTRRRKHVTAFDAFKGRKGRKQVCVCVCVWFIFLSFFIFYFFLFFFFSHAHLPLIYLSLPISFGFSDCVFKVVSLSRGHFSSQWVG
jgi:hypothetical protein